MDLIEKNINDILDSKGSGMNFLNNNSYSDQYKKLAEKWSLLPMYKDIIIVKKFFNLLHSKQVILIISGTGSGKTVIVPKFFLKYVMTLGLKGKIAITNPKILTTTYNAEYGAKTLDVKLGEEVGYKYKGAPRDSMGDKTKLLYVTDGLILATILSGDRLLTAYQGIIIDEAHERHVQIDILLRLLKELLIKRKDFKLIIMSATINAEVFRDYFNSPDITYGEMEVSGESNFPITQNWIESGIKITKNNYLDLAIDQIIKILEKTDNGDIIVFVPTQNDAINGCKLLKSTCPNKLNKNSTNKDKKEFDIKKCDKLFCIEVYSKMKQTNKDLAVDKDLYKKKGFNRKIIFATNVAESSITFDGLVYVIDSGFELANYYDYEENAYVITKIYTSQAQIKQRIGRAGRTQSGISYHIYTQESFNKFKLYPEPNILVIDIIDFILSFIKYAKTIKNVIPLIEGMITVPKIEQVINSLYKLHFTKCIKVVKSEAVSNNDVELSSDSSLGLIKQTESSTKTETISSSTESSTETATFKSNILNIEEVGWRKIRSYNKLIETVNGTLTSVGINILKFKSSPILSSLAIIMSKYMNCQKEIIELMSILETTDGKINSAFDYDRKEPDKLIKYMSKYGVEGSDHLTILNIYKNLYINEKSDEKTTLSKYLNKKTFNFIDSRIRQLTIYANSIPTDVYEQMNIKYKLIEKKPYINKDESDDKQKNILYVLAMSNYYNLIKKEAKNVYTSINFLSNSVAPVEYSIVTPLPKTNAKFAICNSLVNVFGNKSFQCITEISDEIINDMIKEEKIIL
jgi:HrpA-like RNA helicase